VLSVSLKMYKIEYRAVIKLFVKECLTTDAIHLKFIKVYGDCSASFSTIKKWAAEFKRGRTSFESRGDCSCRGVFCRSYEEPLQGRDNGAEASLE